MALINNGTAVVTGVTTLIWDGISRPEQVAATADKGASTKYTIRSAIPQTDPSFAEMQQLLAAEVAKKYPGGAPRGFQHALQTVAPDEIAELAGQAIIAGTTYGSAPAIYDAQGREVAAQSCGLYAGAKVRLIVSPRVYDAKGNVGSAFWLSGIQIMDLAAPKLSVAAGMSRGDVANAFGIQGGAAAFAAPAPAAAAPAPAAAAVPAPNPGILAPTPPAPAAPAGPQLTPAAAAGGLTLESYFASGWTLETLRAHGMIVG